jgi:DNA modification methylase
VTYQLLDGDCLETLAGMEDCSIDAVVTDPPYGLSAEPNAAEVLRHWLAGDDYEHRGGGFMGKTWDSFVPGPKVWAECHRVLKPGGHLLAFFGTRTYDLGAIAIRLGGFEIRDCLAWMYGSGFPKSLDVSKAIDKAAGAEREVVGTKTRPDGSQRLNAGNWQAGMGYHGNGPTAEVATAPATPAAQKWQGWGTALKPAFEPIILARKPLTGTVAANVQEFGTGALNIDGGRVGSGGDKGEWPITSRSAERSAMAGPMDPSPTDQNSGRWPANVILDSEAGAMLDAQSGERPSAGGAAFDNGRIATGGQGGFGFVSRTDRKELGYGDTGGASRFFYCAKASRAERNAGLDGFEERRAGAMAGNAADRPTRTAGDGITPVDPVMARNVHPTVKPIDLMRYLVRLVTPPGGTVLDPFTGSGTTGIAAGLEGFDFIGIEREAEYREIAEARLNWWGDQDGETDEILRRAGLAEKKEREAKESGQASLFDEEAA